GQLRVLEPVDLDLADEAGQRVQVEAQAGAAGQPRLDEGGPAAAERIEDELARPAVLLDGPPRKLRRTLCREGVQAVCRIQRVGARKVKVRPGGDRHPAITLLTPM